MAHALEGRHVVTITPTASGKTLCYNAPVLSGILRDPSTRALYLFPTKALAQDQLAELLTLTGRLEEHVSIGACTYDGDTPQDARRAVRGRAHLVLSNPDMLHSGILPHHPRWAKLFENLRFVVIDELHADRGGLWQPSGQHPPASRPRVCALRVLAGLSLLGGHHREPSGSGRTPDGLAARGRRGSS